MTSKRDHTSTLQSVLRGQSLNIPDDHIYAGPLHEAMEDDCVYMNETGGPPPGDQFGSDKAIQTPTIQVAVRHPDKTNGKSDADDAWAIIHDASPSGYSAPTMRQSGPVKIKVDDDGRHHWGINVELFIYE